jgi:protein involved in polysaccharide export with SLBB domain
MMKSPKVLFLFLVSILIMNGSIFAQDRYLLGEEEQLQIVVFILGEVSKPGEYRVADNTNVVELLSKAGGETQFTNLGSVIITRVKSPSGDKFPESTPPQNVDKEIIQFNVSKYLKNKSGPPPPILKPGDVVYVSKNKWYTWRTVAAVLRDLAVVASAYFLYLRVK